MGAVKYGQAKNKLDDLAGCGNIALTNRFALWSGVIRSTCEPQLGRHCSTMSASLFAVLAPILSPKKGGHLAKAIYKSAHGGLQFSRAEVARFTPRAALKAFESCSTETAERRVFSGAKASKR